MTYVRIHPTINFARVGNSKDYYIAPETMAGEVVDKETGLFGGLPIKRGTENTAITEEDFRDDDGAVKRQAARFRLFAYSEGQTEYPSNDKGQEIKLGSTLPDGRTVTDIVWSVHLANKKNNNYTITDVKSEEEGIKSYEDDGTPPLRNYVSLAPPTGSDKTQEEWNKIIKSYVDENGQVDKNYDYPNDINDTRRRTDLVVDAGPRALAARAGGTLHFNLKTDCSYADGSGQISTASGYMKTFPDRLDMFDFDGPIDTLGEMTVEDGTGRLIVVGGHGRCSAIRNSESGNNPSMTDPIDNNFWFDDTSDGPVDAVIILSDGSRIQAIGSWFVCTDPGYAPQTKNVVSTWDDAFTSWVENLQLMPKLYDGTQYQADFSASFESDILPILHGALLQRWNTSLPEKAIKGHEYIGLAKPSENGSEVLPNFDGLIRNPGLKIDSDGNATPDSAVAQDGEGAKMPLALGDAMKSFLSLANTQYFLMNQWHAGRFSAEARTLGVGEKLDKDVLENCLGGRYSPGIDLTFIVRDVHLYHQDWQGEIGPFRVNGKTLDYANSKPGQPFLGEGYVPLRTNAVEPGDMCKFMSQPWHTDYNSCASHTPDPNPPANNTLYWSWPAQRPVQVYPDFLCTYDSANKVWNLGGQVFSVRGDCIDGVDKTHTNLPENEGKYQEYTDYAANWHKVGFIIQGVQVPSKEHGGNLGSDKFVEVQSQFNSEGDTVMPWPTATTAKGRVT
jgi:hypothetical protein